MEAAQGVKGEAPGDIRRSQVEGLIIVSTAGVSKELEVRGAAEVRWVHWGLEVLLEATAQVLSRRTRRRLLAR